MPSTLLDRIPLPNLKLYTTVSLLLVSGCIYYAINATSDPQWRIHTNSTILPKNLDELSDLSDDKVLLSGENIIINNENSDTIVENNYLNDVKIIENNNEIISELYESNVKNDGEIGNHDSRTILNHLQDIIAFMVQENICIWVS